MKECKYFFGDFCSLSPSIGGEIIDNRMSMCYIVANAKDIAIFVPFQ